MFRLALPSAFGLAILSFSALAASFPSPPLYPSFNAPSASAGVTVIKVAHSLSTNPAAINAKGEITGQYFDSHSSQSRGFIREPDGTIATFSIPGAGCGGTQPRAINKQGVITGIWDDGNGGSCGHGVMRGFVRAANGKITSFDLGGVQGGDVFAINDSDSIVGAYETNTGEPAFLRARNGTMTKLHISLGETQQYPWDINAAGTITGSRDNSVDRTIGFVRTADGTVTNFEVNGARETDPVSINAAGVTAGSYRDQADNWQGFERAAGGIITKIQAPNATQTSIDAINDKGVVTGTYVDKSGHGHSFVRAADGTITVFVVAHSTLMIPLAINTSGTITGIYHDKNDNEWGFVRAP